MSNDKTHRITWYAEGVHADTPDGLTWQATGTHYNTEGKVTKSEVYPFKSREWAELCAGYMERLSPNSYYYDTPFATSGLLTFSGTDGGFYVSATSPPTLGDVLQNTWAEVKPKIIRVTNALLWGEKGKQCK
jgi:hypothetical protein